MAKHSYTPWKWLDEYRGKDFEGEWPSIPQMFDISAKRFPDKECFECFIPYHLVFTYAEALEQVKNVASFLISQGVQKGDRVALTGVNTPFWAIGYLGIVRTGAIVCPVDYALKDEEIEHLIDFAGVKGILLDSERYDRIGKEGKYQFKYKLEEILALPSSNDKYELPVASDLAAFLFTSGTTGTPKAVMLSHENLICDAFIAQGFINIDERLVFYAILPLHHAFTMLATFMETITVGAKLVFGRRLVISQIFKDLKQGNVTVFLAVPMLFNKLIASMMKEVESRGKLVSFAMKRLMGFSGFVKKVFHINPGKFIFRRVLEKVSLDKNYVCIAGGGPLPESTYKRFNQLGIDFVQGYGLTETSPIVTLSPIFDYEEASIGKPLPLTELKFVNVDESGAGEICVRGPQVMKGYYNNPEATAEIIDEDGFLHTGDIGYQDKRGFVYLTGRAKNIIVTEGGKNVFPEEIEDHFQLYEEIEQICIIGYVADKEKKSEGICAIIHPAKKWSRSFDGDVQAHMEEVCETVNKDLLPYKRIRKVIVADNPMEMTSTQKVKRFAVAKQYKDKLS